MAFDYQRPELAGLTIFSYYGNTYTTGESLAGSGTSWSFINTPVSIRGLRLIGTNPSGTGFVLNFTLEPINGTLVTSGSYSSIDANYNSFEHFISFLITPGSWLPKSSRPVQRQDVWGEYHATLPNFYPSSLEFEIVRSTPGEQILNYVAEQVLNARHFLVIDQESEKAYEGPILSDRHLSVGKGYDPFIPVEVIVQKFGSFDPDTETVDWTAFKN